MDLNFPVPDLSGSKAWFSGGWQESWTGGSLRSFLTQSIIGLIRSPLRPSLISSQRPLGCLRRHHWHQRSLSKKSLEISGTLGSVLSCQIPAPDMWWDHCWIHNNYRLPVLLSLDIVCRIWETAGQILHFHTPAEGLGAANPVQRLQWVCHQHVPAVDFCRKRS